MKEIARLPPASLAMPTYRGNEHEEASEIAEVVLDNALNYVDRVLLTNAEYLTWTR